MKIIAPSLLFVLFVCAGLISCRDEMPELVVYPQESVQLQDNRIVQGVVRLKFSETTDVSRLRAILGAADDLTARTGISGFGEMAGKAGLKVMKRLFPYSPKFEKLHEKHGLHLWYELTVDSLLNVRSVAADYLTLEGVEYAGPVYRVTGPGDHTVIPWEENSAERVLSSAASSSTYPFNDPHLPKQWHYGPGETEGASPEANINVFPVWEVCGGSPEVIVAVMDGGIDYSHPDLAENMWVNEAELHGTRGMDDDDNGYVDDIYGYNFVDDNGGKIVAYDHGTHVAGTIAAVNNNGIGVCGVAGGTGNGDGVKLMSCQIFGRVMGDNIQNYPQAFIYAADMGAVISQNSWQFNQAETFQPELAAAIDYFIEEAGNPEYHPDSPMRGGMVIFASGNNGKLDELYYPPAYKNCISVAATDYLNRRAADTEQALNSGKYYANVGTWVTLSAPGGMDGNTYGVLSTITDGKYGYTYGTSMACPHVSGVAALIVSRMKGPGFTNTRLKEILLSSVRDLSPYEPKYAPYMGRGLVQASMILGENDQAGAEAVRDLTTEVLSAAECRLTWTVTRDQGDGVPLFYRVYYSSEPLLESNYTSARMTEVRLSGQKPGETMTCTIEGLAPEQYYFAVVSEDKWGNVSALSNVVSQWMVAAEEMNLFPTVITQQATLLLGAAFGGFVTVRVYDAAGNRVMVQQFDNYGALSVDFGGLSAGIYQVKVKAGETEKIFRIIKK